MIIIGICGQKQAGKSTSAKFIQNYLAKNHNICAMRYSLADEVKRICMVLFGLTTKQVYGSEQDKNSLTRVKWDDVWDIYTYDKHTENMLQEMWEKAPNKTYLTARNVLQVVGTIMRKLNNSCWIEACYDTMLADAGVEVMLIDDIRQENEVDFFHNKQAYLILLDKTIDNDSHESETGLKNINPQKYSLIVKNNNMSQSEKEEKIAEFLSKINWGGN